MPTSSSSRSAARGEIRVGWGRSGVSWEVSWGRSAPPTLHLPFPTLPSTRPYPPPGPSCRACSSGRSTSVSSWGRRARRSARCGSWATWCRCLSRATRGRPSASASSRCPLPTWPSPWGATRARKVNTHPAAACLHTNAQGRSLPSYKTHRAAACLHTNARGIRLVSHVLSCSSYRLGARGSRGQ